MNAPVPEVDMASVATREDAGASPARCSITERLAPLNKKGWRLSFSVSWDGEWDVSGDAGDCNCPYPKEFDPADGHGNSFIGSDEGFKTLDEAITYAEQAIGRITPGSPYPPKPKAVEKLSRWKFWQ